MRVITIASLKGGSTKSTLASALAVRIMRDPSANKVTLLDLNEDSPGGITQWWHLRGQPANPALWPSIDDFSQTIKTLRLQGVDWVVVDTPPYGVDVVEQAIQLADVVLIPVRCSMFDVLSVDTVVELCRKRRKPFGFVLGDFDAKFRAVNESAVEALSDKGPVFAGRLSHRAPYVNAITAGKTAAEIDKSLAPEIDGVWSETLALVGGPS